MIMNNEGVVWKRHPLHPHIEASTEGCIRLSGRVINPYVYNGLLKIKISRKIKLNAARLVLCCFVGIPSSEELHKFTVGYIDDDPLNIKPDNLYWKQILP